MKHNSFPKIPQFRNVIKEIAHQAAFQGLDENHQPIYDPNPTLPTVVAQGTVKLHGTNAGVSWNREDGLYVQSRNQCLSLDGDGHFGFVDFVRQNKVYFTLLLNTVLVEKGNPGDTVTVFGEWAGQGIQKGVGIALAEPTFFIFDCKIKNFDTEKVRWVANIDHYIIPTDRIKCIRDYPTYEIKIDFADPKQIQNQLISITNNVEAKCPVAAELGYDGMGEGVVYRFVWNNNVYRFKVKGDKHSVTKVKTLAAVDTEKLNSIKEFVEYAVTQQRVEQAMQETGATSQKQTGDVLRWIANDIMAEEADTLAENNLEWKDVGKAASGKARKMFFALLFDEVSKI